MYHLQLSTDQIHPSHGTITLLRNVNFHKSRFCHPFVLSHQIIPREAAPRCENPFQKTFYTKGVRQYQGLKEISEEIAAGKKFQVRQIQF